MKKLFLLTTCIVFNLCIKAQSDTLYFEKNKKIACKLLEISEYEIKYKLFGDGPIVFCATSSVIKYTLKNGYTEYINKDEMELVNSHESILQNREAIKIHPFAIGLNHISLAYEKVIRLGINLDVQVGYITSQINREYYTLTNNGANRISDGMNGVYIKPGIKFLLSPSNSVKGVKLAHPLKGAYAKFDLAYSFLQYNNLKATYYSQSSYSVPAISVTKTSDLTSSAYGGFVNLGYQTILGNILTMDVYAGVGFTGQTQKLSNPDFKVNPFFNSINYNYSYVNDYSRISNYYGFSRVPNFGLSGTFGFRIGYLIPYKEKKLRPDPNTSLQKN